MIDLGAQNLRQLDHLSPRIGEFETHKIFAGDRLYHTDAHQTQRPRQILGQIHDLTAFDTRGRLNFVTGDNGACLGRHDLHLHTEISQFFLNQAQLRDRQGNTLASLELFPAVSENPTISLDVKGAVETELWLRDNNGNDFKADL